MGRRTCLLQNEELVESFKKIAEHMRDDYVEYGLEACTDCQRDQEGELCTDLHRNLVALYNTLSQINRQIEIIQKNCKI